MVPNYAKPYVINPTREMFTAGWKEGNKLKKEDLRKCHHTPKNGKRGYGKLPKGKKGRNRQRFGKKDYPPIPEEMYKQLNKDPVRKQPAPWKLAPDGTPFPSDGKEPSITFSPYGVTEEETIEYYYSDLVPCRDIGDLPHTVEKRNRYPALINFDKKCFWDPLNKVFLRFPTYRTKVFYGYCVAHDSRFESILAKTKRVKELSTDFTTRIEKLPEKTTVKEEAEDCKTNKMTTGNRNDASSGSSKGKGIGQGGKCVGQPLIEYSKHPLFIGSPKTAKRKTRAEWEEIISKRRAEIEEAQRSQAEVKELLESITDADIERARK
ncbi:MAG: hypothetical protein GY940_20595, partial [bacterium]|nr:hypothetical protein [bacterium]